VFIYGLVFAVFGNASKNLRNLYDVRGCGWPTFIDFQTHFAIIMGNCTLMGKTLVVNQKVFIVRSKMGFKINVKRINEGL